MAEVAGDGAHRPGPGLALEAAEAAAALCALAGPRRGEALVVAPDAPPVAARALRAATSAAGSDPVSGEVGTGRARLALAGASAAGAEAVVGRLGPGGRLVALAPDAATARALAARLGLRVRALVPLTAGVAWAGVLPDPPSSAAGAALPA